MAGNLRLWDLRVLKDVVIPDGTEEIGNLWFAGSSIESVTIPVSVREIHAGAFCCCRSLAKVMFK